jgi:hypothetical protein
MDIDINYLAVLVAAIAAYAVGAVWYSPIGFGKWWMKEMGLKKDEMHKMPLSPTQAMTLGFVFTLLLSYVFAHFVVLVGVADVASALTLGFWAWLGFGFTTLSYSWLYEGKSVRLFLFNAAHLLVALLAMSLVYGLWQ